MIEGLRPEQSSEIWDMGDAKLSVVEACGDNCRFFPAGTGIPCLYKVTGIGHALMLFEACEYSDAPGVISIMSYLNDPGPSMHTACQNAVSGKPSS